MSENVVTLTRDDKSATALIRHERSTSKIRYAEYVSDHDVTLETVPAHVQALADLAGSIRKWESAAERKAFCTKIRNGLKYQIAALVEDSEEDSEEEAAEGEGEGEGSEETAEVDPMEAVLAAARAAIEAGVSKADIAKAIKGL